MATNIDFAGVTFDEALDYLRKKINLPTQTWKDIWHSAHTKAFTIAGAMKEDLLNDFRNSINKAIAEGVTLKEFKKDFTGIVKKHGWSFNGAPGWRSRVIYETNIQVAYSTGRYKQMQAIKKQRPYWEYRHNDSINPRKLHLSWHGKVLSADDAWWDTHYPPNGWGCRCSVVALSKRDINRLNKNIESAPQNGFYEWTDKATGAVHTIPNGIDPGWAYNPGQVQ